MDTSRTCSRCGNALQPNDKFCKNCGQPVDSGATQAMHPPMDSGATQVMHPPEAEAARASYTPPPPGPGYQPPGMSGPGYQPPAASGPGYQPPPGGPPAYQPPGTSGPGYQPPPAGSQTYGPAGTSGPGYQPPPGGPAYAPPPAGYAGPPPVAAPTGRPRWLFPVIGCLGLLIVGCMAFFGFTFFVANNLTQPMSTAGESFMTAVRDGNYPQAYALCTPALQQELGDISEFESTMQDNRPKTWSFTSRKVENDTGQLDGTATLDDGSTADVRLVLDQVGGAWKVSGINIQPR
jgi:zinc ribbon protein